MKRVAVVGLSAKPDRASYGIARFLVGQGFEVVGVNPVLKEDVLGIKVFPSLSDVPGRIDVVDIFRRSDRASTRQLIRLRWVGRRVHGSEHTLLANAAQDLVALARPRCDRGQLPRSGSAFASQVAGPFVERIARFVFCEENGASTQSLKRLKTKECT